MYCNQIFALITPNSLGANKVKNVIVADNYEVANRLARISYTPESFAVDVTLCPVAIGDTYTDGVFYRQGEVVPVNPTEAEEILALKAENQTVNANIEQLSADNADLLYELSMLSLAIAE